MSVMDPTAKARIATAAGAGNLGRVGVVLLALGAAICAAALLVDRDVQRFGFAYLWGYAFLWVVVLGSLFLVMLHHLARAVWSVVVRRVAETVAAATGVAAVLFLPILLFGVLTDQFHLFPWVDEHLVHADHRLFKKALYLNVPFFSARAVLFFALWVAFAFYYVRTSLRQDRGQGGAEATARMRRLSAPFMVLFALTVTFASFDWLMSLEPRWYSTMFGVYVFSGMAVTAFAVLTLGVLWLRDTGRLEPGLITEDHLYNLGAWLFAWTCFWAYIAFSQYMLIWYGNLPEETFYMVRRLSGGWWFVSIALALVRFVVPFLVLLSRRAKTNAGVLRTMAVWVLLGQLLDLYWLVMPQLHGAGPVLGWQELGPLVLMIGVLLVCVARFLGRHAPVAVGDPLLEESKRFHL